MAKRDWGKWLDENFLGAIGFPEGMVLLKPLGDEVDVRVADNRLGIVIGAEKWAVGHYTEIGPDNWNLHNGDLVGFAQVAARLSKPVFEGSDDREIYYLVYGNSIVAHFPHDYKPNEEEEEEKEELW